MMQLKQLFVKDNVIKYLSIPALEQPILKCYILYILIYNFIFSCLSFKKYFKETLQIREG